MLQKFPFFFFFLRVYLSETFRSYVGAVLLLFFFPQPCCYFFPACFITVESNKFIPAHCIHFACSSVLLHIIHSPFHGLVLPFLFFLSRSIHFLTTVFFQTFFHRVSICKRQSLFPVFFVCSFNLPLLFFFSLLSVTLLFFIQRNIFPHLLLLPALLFLGGISIYSYFLHPLFSFFPPSLSLSIFDFTFSFVFFTLIPFFIVFLYHFLFSFSFP